MGSTLALSSRPHPADGLVGTAKLWLEAWLGKLVVNLISSGPFCKNAIRTNGHLRVS